MIHHIAYGTLFLDMAITVLTLFSLSQIENPREFLVPVEFVLSVAVVISIIAGVMVLYLQHYEKLLEKTLRIGNHIMYGIDKIKKPRYRFRREPSFLERLKKLLPGK